MPRGTKRTEGKTESTPIDGKPDAGPDSGGSSPDARSVGGIGDSIEEPGRPEPIEQLEFIEPSAIPIGEQPVKQRRSRRTKAEILAARGETASPDSLVDLSTLLLSLHAMGAAILNIEELALEREEARAMADAVKEVAKYYPMAISAKKVAIANLVIVAGGIYTTRAMAWHQRHKKATAEPSKLAVMGEARPVGTNAAQGTGTPAMTTPSDLWPLAPDENVTM